MTGLNRHLVRFRALYEERLKSMSSEDREKSRAQRAKYAENGNITLQDSYRFACMLLVLEDSASFDKAVENLSSIFGNSKMRTEDLLIEAINHAAENWKNEHQDSLYKKGLIRGTDQFFKAGKFLTKGDVFDRHRPYVPAEMQPVLDIAIDYLKGSKEDGLKISPTVLCIIMAYMIPEEMGAKILKDFRAKKALNISVYEENVQRAKEAVAILFGKLDLSLSSLNSLAKGMPVQADKKPSDLERNLNELGYSLSAHEKDVYLAYTKNKTGNSVTDAMKVVSLFNKRTKDIITHKEKVTPEFLRATVQKVEKLLKTQADSSRKEASPAKAALTL